MKSKKEAFKKLKRGRQGITLIALVVTIIVLLILAAVAINLTIGSNGIFKRSQDATKMWNYESAHEGLEVIVAQYPMYKIEGGTEALDQFMLNNGVTRVENYDDENYLVEYKGYEFVVNKITGEIKEVENLGGIVPKIETMKTLSSDKKSVTITAKITNEVETINSIELYDSNNQKVEETSMDLANKMATFIVYENEIYTVKAKATTEGIQRSENTKVEVTEIQVSFSSDFGRIEIVWIDQENNIIDNPLSPETSLNGMTPVKWNGTEEVIANSDNSDGWYSYIADTGTEDNLNSYWANAKDGDNYFVWIPRYAYRITYYEDEISTQPTGYYDGRGMVNVQGEVQNNCTLEPGIETVEKNGKSYIVHPAFMNDYTNDEDDTNDFNLGGWDSDLAGIWVGKYETSGIEGDLKIIPNADSINATIGEMYTYAKSYPKQDSHLLKNSEWGAVTYLTHSQYGRNGHKIFSNNSNTITGNSCGSTNTSTATGQYSYETENGQKASSTGNIYGVYDLAGGCFEYIAAFNSYGYSSNLEYGSSFALSGKSDKYATLYPNNSYSFDEYSVSKTGDAIKEVHKSSEYKSWNDDKISGVTVSNSFFARGGRYYGDNASGMLFSDSYNGNNYNDFSFRIVIPGAGLE